jgi:hypothetical protein
MAKGVKGTSVHGTRTMYGLGCRCQECKAANARETRLYRERQKQKGLDNPELIPHGTYHGYVGWGCRCEECGAANLEYQRAHTKEYGRTRRRWDRYTQQTQAAAKKGKAGNDEGPEGAA